MLYLQLYSKLKRTIAHSIKKKKLLFCQIFHRYAKNECGEFLQSQGLENLAAICQKMYT